MHLEDSVAWGEFLDWAIGLPSDRIVGELEALEEFLDCSHLNNSSFVDCMLMLREVLRDECVRRVGLTASCSD